jgi:hypothetical protein
MEENKENDETRFERCTFWSTLKFQRCSSCHIMGIYISRATKGIKGDVIFKGIWR